MDKTNSPGLTITSLQLAGAAFTTFMGALLLVAPYHLGGPNLTALQWTLPVWGITCLAAGAALACVAATAPGPKLLRAAHVLAGGTLLMLAIVSVADRNWTSLAPFVIFGVGVAAAPYLAAQRSAASPRGDLLTILLGLATGATGVLMLATQNQFSAPAYDEIRPDLSAFGTAFVIAGFALVAVHTRARSAWLRRLAFLAEASVLFAFLVGVSIPSGNWIGMAYYGGFGTLALLLPWIGPRASQLDGASLRAQLALVLAAAAAVPFLVLAPLYAYHQEQQAVADQLGRQQTVMATLAQNVSDYVNLHQAAVNQLAGQPGLLALSPSQQHALLENAAAAYPEVNGFSTVAADGEPIARADDAPGTSWIGDSTFEAARRTDLPSLGIRVSPITYRPVFTLGAPILGPGGSFLGMVSSSLDSSRIAALVSRTDFGAGSQVYLVDTAGHLIAGPDPALVATFADMSGDAAVAAFRNDPLPSGSVAGAGPSAPTLASYARVPNLGWGVIVEQPTAAALAATRAQTDVLFLALLAMTVVAATFGVVSAGWLGRPLATLVAAVDRLAAGDASAPLPASGLTEIVGLSTAFRTMRTRLAERTTEREQAVQALQHLALHDALTGLPNRVLFTDRLKHALAATNRRANSVAVLFLDLDDFKIVNDRLGHARGDELLVAIAARLRGCIRPADTVARLGGDEFTVLLEDIGGEAEAVAVAERITLALRQPMVGHGPDEIVNVSIGIAIGGSDAEAKSLLHAADLAMYAAKNKIKTATR